MTCTHFSRVRGDGRVSQQPPVIVFRVDGVDYPFILCRDHWENQKWYLVAPLLTTEYSFYLDYMQPFLDADVVEGIHKDCWFPLLNRSDVMQYDTFRDFLKHGVSNNFIPHFFGTKSEQVSWGRLVKHPDGMVLSQLAEATAQHSTQFLRKFAEPERYSYFALSDTRLWIGVGDLMNPIDGQWLMGATHETDGVVSAMLISALSEGVNCASISALKSDKYKPFSLITAAHLAVIRDMFYPDKGTAAAFVNLGLNFDDCAQYKNVIKGLTQQPFKNFKVFSSFNQLRTVLSTSFAVDVEQGLDSILN